MFLSEDGTDSSDVFRFPACTVGSSLDGIIIGAGKQNVFAVDAISRPLHPASNHSKMQILGSVSQTNNAMGICPHWLKQDTFGGRHSPVPLKKLDIDIHRKSCQHCYFVTWCFLFHWITQDKYAPQTQHFIHQRAMVVNHSKCSRLPIFSSQISSYFHHISTRGLFSSFCTFCARFLTRIWGVTVKSVKCGWPQGPGYETAKVPRTRTHLCLQHRIPKSGKHSFFHTKSWECLHCQYVSMVEDTWEPTPSFNLSFGHLSQIGFQHCWVLLFDRFLIRIDMASSFHVCKGWPLAWQIVIPG